MREPLRHEWPGARKSDQGFWWTVAGAVTGFVALIVPYVHELSAAKQVAIFFACALSPAVFIAVQFLIDTAIVAVRRATAYGAVVASYYRNLDELQRARDVATKLLKRLTWLVRYEIDYTFVQNDTPYIAVGRRSGQSLVPGNRLSVLNNDDAGFLGTFEVVEVKAGHYRV